MDSNNISLKMISSVTEQDLINLKIDDIANLICNTAKDLETQKDRINTIKERGFFKRMFANNTKDLANIIEDHINVSNKILFFINKIILVNFKNRKFLQKLEEQLLALAEVKNLSNNELIINSASMLETDYSNLQESDFTVVNAGFISKNRKLIIFIITINILIASLAYTIFKIF